jgi:hypothetical protein
METGRINPYKRMSQESLATKVEETVGPRLYTLNPVDSTAGGTL